MREREGEKHRWVREISPGCLSHDPNWRPGLPPRHVPLTGNQPETFLFTGQCSIHWATPTGLFVIILEAHNELWTAFNLSKFYNLRTSHMYSSEAKDHNAFMWSTGNFMFSWNGRRILLLHKSYWLKICNVMNFVPFTWNFSRGLGQRLYFKNINFSL